MLHGETTARSELGPARRVAKLQAHGVEHPRGEARVWVIVDGSDPRKPHAREMAHRQRVKRLDGAGTVNGYLILKAIGIGSDGRRGLPYHTLSSSAAGTRRRDRVAGQPTAAGWPAATGG